MNQFVKKELTIGEVPKFLERFNNFHDAVIHTLKMDLFSSKLLPKSIQVVFGVFESGFTDRKNLTLEIEDVTKFHLFKERIYNLSISFWENIAYYDGEWYFNFKPLDLYPNGPEDFENQEPKGVLATIIGKRCFWYLSPYMERH